MRRDLLLRTVAVIALVALNGAGTIARPADTSRSAALAFTLADSAGVVHSERELQQARAAVFYFIMPDCPISQSYVPEMNRIADAYAARGIRFFAVQADLAATAATVRQHVREYGYRFPVLLDPRQLLVRRTGASVTPEVIVITPGGSVLYQGRIDNRVVSLGTTRPQATEFDLRNALTAVLAHRPVPLPKTTAYGCLITKSR
jgi:thiol-disulfide isomerase/thioredoxin